MSAHYIRIQQKLERNQTNVSSIHICSFWWCSRSGRASDASALSLTVSDSQRDYERTLYSIRLQNESNASPRLARPATQYPTRNKHRTQHMEWTIKYCVAEATGEWSSEYCAVHSSRTHRSREHTKLYFVCWRNDRTESQADSDDDGTFKNRRRIFKVQRSERHALKGLFLSLYIETRTDVERWQRTFEHTYSSSVNAHHHHSEWQSNAQSTPTEFVLNIFCDVAMFHSAVLLLLLPSRRRRRSHSTSNSDAHTHCLARALDRRTRTHRTHTAAPIRINSNTKKANESVGESAQSRQRQAYRGRRIRSPRSHQRAPQPPYICPGRARALVDPFASMHFVRRTVSGTTTEPILVVSF